MARGRIEKRGVRSRQIKPVVLIVTEGSQTEPRYFEHFRNRQANIDIRIVGNKVHGGSTDYTNLVRKAVRYQKKDQISKRNGDSVWVVADGDVNYRDADPIAIRDTQLEKAREMAQMAGIKVIISNPCFEFWYLLHFDYTTKYFRDYNTVITALSRHISNYKNTTDVFDQLLPYMALALDRAECIEQYHIDNGSSIPLGIATNPFTEVFRLVQALR